MTQGLLLPNRGVLKISGKDRADFLQGLITNDVDKITPEKGIYAALLSPQGKFQYDLIIVAFKDSSGDEVWLMECDRDRADALLTRLSLYKLRSEVVLENVSDFFSVYVVWDGGYGNPSRVGQTKLLDGGVGFVDPRSTELGARFIFSQDKAHDFFETHEISLTSFEDYDLHRIKLGVPDGSRDVLIDRGILLECGFDELNAIDWGKGCYMGQELTARTRYRGLVRKRLIPVHIHGETPPFQSPILQDNREVGELRSTQKDWGIAMLRLEALHKSLPFSCGNATVTPHIPEWMCLPSLTDEE
jgi:folate-binding protein YgfZ